MLNTKTREKLLQIVNDFINGNLTDSAKAIRGLTKAQLAYLLVDVAPVHLNENGKNKFDSHVICALTTN